MVKYHLDFLFSVKVLITKHTFEYLSDALALNMSVPPDPKLFSLVLFLTDAWVWFYGICFSSSLSQEGTVNISSHSCQEPSLCIDQGLCFTQAPPLAACCSIGLLTVRHSMWLFLSYVKAWRKKNVNKHSNGSAN